MKSIDVIGRAEKIDFVDLGFLGVPAKIDTGADSSSLWVSSAEATDNGLEVVFFGEESPFYTGNVVRFEAGAFQITRVANSFGHKELRYKLKLRIKIKGRLINATFTLSDRSTQTYPVLIGRKLLAGKFLVDVKKGEALTKIEHQKTLKLKDDLLDLESRRGDL